MKKFEMIDVEVKELAVSHKDDGDMLFIFEFRRKWECDARSCHFGIDPGTIGVLSILTVEDYAKSSHRYSHLHTVEDDVIKIKQYLAAMNSLMNPDPIILNKSIPDIVRQKADELNHFSDGLYRITSYPSFEGEY